MKLILEDNGEHFEFEAEAAYIAMMKPKDSDGDSVLMVIGRANVLGILKAVAHSLSSFIQSLSKGSELEQKKLWKVFKEEYREAKYSSSFNAKRNEIKPVTEEDTD